MAAAHRAFPAWAAMAAHERGRLLLKLADRIEANAESSRGSKRSDTGHPIRDYAQPRRAAHRGDASAISAAWPTRSRARWFRSTPGFLNYVTREPVGVVGQIVPWNFPLMFTSWKMAPALAAGQHAWC